MRSLVVASSNRRSVTLTSVLVAVGACSTPVPAQPAAPAPTAPTSSTRSAPTAPAIAHEDLAPPPAAPTLDLQLEKLGYGGVPAAPTAKAEKALADGIATVAKGNLDFAAMQLTAALAESPQLAEAHYQLAIVYAKQHKLVEATAELEDLLSRDLSIGARLDADPAFAALRAGPEAEALHLRRVELERLWTEAIAHGSPMLMFDGKHGNQEILQARVLRPGVWVASAHSFFPIGPAFADAMAGWVDLANQRVITVSMQVDDCRSDFCPRINLITVHVQSLAAVSVPIAVWTHHATLAHGVTVETGARGVRVQVEDCDVANCRSDWEVLDQAGHHVDKDQHAHPGDTTLVVDHRGTDLIVPAAGFAITGNSLKLPDHAAIPLDKRVRSTDFHDLCTDATSVLVASTVDRCECGEHFEGHILVHEVARVNRSTGAVEVLSHGKGMIVATAGRNGDLYVQRDTVERFLVIVPPIGGRSCCGL